MKKKSLKKKKWFFENMKKFDQNLIQITKKKEDPN